MALNLEEDNVGIVILVMIEVSKKVILLKELKRLLKYPLAKVC